MKKLMVLIGLIVLVVGGVYLMTATGKTVDVAWTEADYEQAMAKLPIRLDTIESVNLEALAMNGYTAAGSLPAEVDFSSEEFSALVAKANDAKGPIRGTKLRFTGQDAGEVSFRLSDGFAQFLRSYGLVGWEPGFTAALRVAAVMPLSGGLTEQLVAYVADYVGNKPVYANGYLRKTGPNAVEADITTLKVGQLSMNDAVISRTEYEVTRILNAVITRAGLPRLRLRLPDLGGAAQHQRRHRPGARLQHRGAPNRRGQDLLQGDPAGGNHRHLPVNGDRRL